MAKITLILGGAASGKSLYAEKLALKIAKRQSGKPAYIATAQSFDGEMDKKIALHQSRRSCDWQLFEYPLAPEETFLQLSRNDVALLDCITMWLSNLFFDDTLVQGQERFLQACRNHRGKVILVSNEVGQGIVPASSEGRAFRNIQGHMNQRLAEMANRVILVTAGLPVAIKGKLPKGF